MRVLIALTLALGIGVNDAFRAPLRPLRRQTARFAAEEDAAFSQKPESELGAGGAPEVPLDPSPSASLDLDFDLDEVRSLRAEIAELDRQLKAANGKGEFGKAADLQRELELKREKDPLLVLDREIAASVLKSDYEEAAALKDRRNRLNRICPVPVVKTNRLLMLSENGRFLITSDATGKKIRRFNKRLDSSTPTAITEQGKARQIQQPTWSRAGDRIAFVSLVVGTSGMEKAQLVVMEEETMKLVQAVPIEFPPIYMQWAPDDSYITYLSTGRDGRVRLHYMEVRTAGVTRVRSKVLDAGTPLFYAFTGPDPASADLVVHNAERKTIYRYEGQLGTGNAEEAAVPAPAEEDPATEAPDDMPVSMGPGNFMAPRGWTAPTETRWGSIVVENGFLVTVDIGGRFRRRLVPVRGITSFVLSPDQSKIALLQSDVKTGHYSLSLLDVGEHGAGLDPRASPLPKITQRELEVDTICKAMFFSPDSSKLLIFSLPYPRADVAVAANAFKSNFAVKCRWLVYDVHADPESDAPNPVPFPQFTPRPYFMRLYLPFFDQYAQSFTPWSPDSKSFVFVAQEGVFVQPLPDPMPSASKNPASAEAAADAGVSLSEMASEAELSDEEEASPEKEEDDDADVDMMMVPTMEELQEALDAARRRAETPGPNPNPKPIKLGKGVEVAVWSWN
eukprot:CAMPEP_0118854732 /NCGR_PEP_ID=MMETSP1163-20130328/2831_1 /TAXON_ID=124430 /ORGANISM="Phaeomonas parva, Strain CCMP2877" /LENGTH=677 /DNA_ID=CAMNT_0006787501 /DNA_START=302 /DNA_END=2335 /DNA_ORIENTATION=+